MIAARDYKAVFRIDSERGQYVACDVIAWATDGAAMCVGRRGALVPAHEHPLFVGLLGRIPDGSTEAQIEAWFRKSLGLAPDAVLQRPPSPRTVGPAYPRPMVPAEPTIPAEAVDAVPETGDAS